MTHTTLASIRFLSLSAILAASLPLHAAGQIQVPWNQVCKAANGNRLTLTTTGGDTVDGYCASITVDEIALNTKYRGVVRIARQALSRIDMQRSSNQGHQLDALGRGMRKGFGLLLSPWAPLGLAVVPPMLAWDAVAAPFCLIGDSIHQQPVTQEIKVN